MSITAPPPTGVTSDELAGLIEQGARLARAAGREDLIERLNRARGLLAARRTRVVLVGAPGQGTSSLAGALERAGGRRLPGAAFVDDGSRVPDPGAADVVLVVTAADHEYGPWELDVISRLRADGVPVAGVLTKIDVNPRWADVQQADRRRLQAVGLDDPSVPLVPVSAAVVHSAVERGDESLVVASGVPQLLDLLRDRIGTRVEPGLSDAVLAEVRAVSGPLAALFDAELDALTRNGAPRDHQQRAVDELDRRQQLSAAWQIALGDGATELASQVDFDLRDRLREVLDGAETEIDDDGAPGDWARFERGLRTRVDEAVADSYGLARRRAQRLAEQVAARMTGTRDTRSAGVPLPAVQVEHPDDPLAQVRPMRPPERGGVFPRVVNSLRGSYGGILMVGVLTSLAGLQLISVYSVGAGVLLGAFTFWEDRRNGRERAKIEAKVALSKLMDGVNFRVGDHLRTQLRAMHRDLRDHFTTVNDKRLREAADAVRAAAAAAQDGQGWDTRMAELRTHLAEARRLQSRAGGRPA